MTGSVAGLNTVAAVIWDSHSETHLARNKIKIQRVGTPREPKEAAPRSVSLISAVAGSRFSFSVAFIQPPMVADSAHLNTPLLQHHVLVAQFAPKC